MPDYSKTVIYKIVCKDINIKESYGGHTTHIVKRRQMHKSKCNNENDKLFNSYVYKFIRDNGGWENWDLIWQYDFPCDSKKEAELEERKFIEKEKCELNSYKLCVTDEENKERIKKNHIEYYEKCKDEINEKRKLKYKCQCGSNIRICDKARHERSKKHIKYCQQI
jgi:hypothetical protein